VIVEAGRRYWHNAAAVDLLARRAPLASIDVGGHTAVRVYRLDAGSALFPGATDVHARR
jgi:hypothetical protein